MHYSDNPPTYEESLSQSKCDYSTNSSYVTYDMRGPDAICRGKYFILADFIPWSESTSNPEELGFLLRRINNWLSANCQMKVTKCEFVPRMIDSRKRFDSSKCYIFFLTFGRTIFVNQLRLHISVDKLKTEPDHICMRTYIPKMVTSGSNDISSLSRKYYLGIDKPVFEDMSALISKINADIKNGVISGEITNVSTFHYKVMNDFYGLNDTLFYRNSDEPKFHVKSLRVFYKYGKPINGVLCLKSFITMNETSKLDDLTEKARSFVNDMTIQNFISMETFPELQEVTEFELQKKIVDQNSTLVYGKRFVRIQSIRVFYFTESDSILKPLQFEYGFSKIFWITPRKVKNTYENYISFTEYANYIIQFFDKSILDVETILVPNALSWSQVRHQTIFSYSNEQATNYQIYAIRLILKENSVIAIGDAPRPYHFLTEEPQCRIS